MLGAVPVDGPPNQSVAPGVPPSVVVKKCARLNASPTVVTSFMITKAFFPFAHVVSPAPNTAAALVPRAAVAADSQQVYRRVRLRTGVRCRREREVPPAVRRGRRQDRARRAIARRPHLNDLDPGPLTTGCCPANARPVIAGESVFNPTMDSTRRSTPHPASNRPGIRTVAHQRPDWSRIGILRDQASQLRHPRRLSKAETAGVIPQRKARAEARAFGSSFETNGLVPCPPGYRS